MYYFYLADGETNAWENSLPRFKFKNSLTSKRQVPNYKSFARVSQECMNCKQHIDERFLKPHKEKEL